MRILIYFLFLGLLATTATARQNSPDSTVAVVVADSLHQFTLVANKRFSIGELVKTVRVLETEGSDRWLTDSKRRQIAKAAWQAAKATKVDPILLLSVARVESDFQRILSVYPRCDKPGVKHCMADCGVTQHWLHGNPSWVKRRCKQIAQSYKLSFALSAKELAYHIDWCRKHPKRHRPLQRCVLNRYNSGPNYKTVRKCRKYYRLCKQACAAVPGSGSTCAFRCRREFSKCWNRAHYWRKVLCFRYGALQKKRAKFSCRKIKKLSAIQSRFYP